MCACVAVRERSSFVERCVIQRRGQSHREGAADDAAAGVLRCTLRAGDLAQARHAGTGRRRNAYCVPRNAPASTTHAVHDETCSDEFSKRFRNVTMFPASAVWWTVAGAMDWVAIAPEEQRMRLALALARAATRKLRSRSPRSAPSLPSSPKARLGLSPRERATLHAFAPMSPRIKGCPAEEVCAHAYEPSGPSSALSHSSSLTATDASLCFSMLPRRSASKTACST